VGKERGPRIGSLALAFGKEKVAARLKELSWLKSGVRQAGIREDVD
jgi:hypothetical protein